ncbi:NADP-dependent oxidoreductase domain-containing protein [Crucibulum laeve]|uniref:NADP-dependent oxidoreductase domain-containing protein n=1 Tax=Crucibulum laeve TaxID=68775 RepID=A0A5C3M628_9AGAR|nr:NADP-dependent oxidoreductase domain-containing protein [Crucibulum laeve]
MSIPTRKIGTTNVSEIGFGAMGMSAMYGKAPSDEERFKVLDAAFAQGCTFWDTADVYADSEDVIGKWFKRTGNRDKIFLATKFGIFRQPNRLINGDPEYVKASCEKSLKRLGVSHIDLFYLHRADKTVPIERTVGAMAELVKEGKVKYLGLSEISAATLRRAHAVHPIAAVQVEYSPFTLDIEDEKIGLLKACRELGVKIVGYAPLGRGLLTGQYKSPDDFEEGDFRKTVPRYSKENFPKVLQVVDGLKAIADRHHATPGQVALAWILAQGDDFFPIPGTKNVKYLNENVGASKVKLTDVEVGEVRKIARDAGASDAARYPVAQLGSLFVDTPEL